MRKIDQQRIEFLQKINFTHWSKDQKPIQSYNRVRSAFLLYHDVMFDYHACTRGHNIELFVRNWWFHIIHPNLQSDIKLHTQRISAQRAVYSIDWDACAFCIINEIRDKTSWILADCIKN